MSRNIRARFFTASRPRMIANLSVASLATVAFIVAATKADGYHATNVDLNDGTVWVSNQATGQVGRLNIRIDELDFGIVNLLNPDVVQDGRDVFAADDAGLSKIDVATGGNQLTKNAIAADDYHLGGGVGVLFDPTTGRLWTGSSRSLVAPEYPKKADGEIAPGSAVVVTQSGTVLAVDRAGGAWFEIALNDQLKPVDPNAEEATDEAPSSTSEAPDPTTPPSPGETVPEEILPIVPATAARVEHGMQPDTAVTAVGDTLAFLDADGTVYGVDGDLAQVPGTSFALQAPGPEADTVLVASDEGLFEVELGGSEVTPLSDLEGMPVQPVRVGSCAYGAWSSDAPTWFRDCPGKAPLKDNAIPNAIANADLRFRVNQSNVALNEIGTGGVWTEHDGRLVQISNWGDVDTDDANDDVTDTGQNTQDDQEVICVTDQQVAPTAGDDPTIGLRNRQTVIDVLTNDADQNCEPIAVVEVQAPSSDLGSIAIIDNGQHLLYTPGPGVVDGSISLPQPYTFTYVVGDTTGQRSGAATVTALITDPATTNSPPQLRKKGDGSDRKMRTVVESGRLARYNVLADWWDPDGDDLRLVDARAESGLGEVSFSPDGLVRYGAYGVGPGIQSISVRVSDGQVTNSETAAQLEVTVQTDGQQIKPVVQHDFITLTEGDSGVVLPLANDYDGNGDPLSLQFVAPAVDAGVRAQLTADGLGLTVTGVTAGVWPIVYTANDGSSAGADATAQGMVRVTVLAKPPTNAVPVAVPDKVLIKPGRVLNVDVLANDLDDDGDLLAIVRADAAEPTDDGGGVRVSVVDRRVLQVELVTPTTGAPTAGPFSVNYSIDDGQGSIGADGVAISHVATGTLTVLVDPATFDQPPVTSADTLSVRAGDVASIGVTANDVDPDGDKIELVGVNAIDAAEMEAAGSVVVWTDGQKLFARGGNPGRYVVHYDVVANGMPASGEVAIEVRALPTDEAPNQSPTAVSLDVRAVRGGTVRIKVPVAGIDPDGDAVAVTSVGASAQATQGVLIGVSDTEPNVLLYSVDQASVATTDTFQYTVQDAFGGFSVGTVRVVIVSVEAHPPVAHDDIWKARPGRELVLSVLANDVDADDDPLSFPELPFFDLDGQPSADPQHPESITVIADGDTAETRGRLSATVPAAGEPVLSERYRVTDGTSFGDAYVRIIPDPTAPNMKPVAIADVVTAAEIQGLTSIEVPVLANDVDPDDATATLTVTLPGPQPGTNVTSTNGSTVTVTLGPAPQLVVYKVTDSDPESPASAFATISVPGLENHPPVLNEVGSNPETFRVKADAPPITISIPDIVSDPDGDPGVQLTATEVTANGTGGVTRVDDRSFTFQPDASALLGYTATVTFEVVDRPDDPDTAKTALLTITIPVDPPANTPPTIERDGAVSVPILDEPVSYDLAPLATDLQNDPLTFAVTEAPAGFTVTQAGSQLTITSTDETHAVGQTFRLQYSVTDGQADSAPVIGIVLVTITRTNKGQPAALSIGPLDGVKDKASAGVDVIAQATNPFPDKPLTIKTVSVSGGGSVGCSASCAQSPIVFTPSAIGTQIVTYTVEDAIHQVATGTITYVVKGLPLVPGVPVPGEVSDKTVNLTWSAADVQGGTLDHYVVVTDTGLQMTSTTTSLAFNSGLVNAQPYRFAVYAVNEIGNGPQSTFSNIGIPDRVPDPPVNPRFTDYGDGTLMLAWEAPPTASNYSAIKNYRVSVHGGPTQIVPAPTNTLTVTGLSNGTAYTFSVEAQNDATANQGWGSSSVGSLSEIPSRYPDPPTNVNATAAGDGGSARVKVVWAAPAFNGGRAVSNYDVCRVQDGSCQNVAALTATFDAAVGSDNSFTVVAHNTDVHRNNSESSGASNIVHGVVTPGAPVIIAAVSDHRIDVVAALGNDGGCSTTYPEYSINGGASWTTSSAFTGLTNGQSYSAVSRMTIGAGCLQDLGPGASPYSANSNTDTVTPYGDLVQPSMNVSGSGTTLTWSWNANQGDNGRPASFSLTGDCPNGPTSPTGSWAHDYGYLSGNKWCQITVSAPGVSSLSARADLGTPPPPPPSLSGYLGTTPYNPGNGTCSGGCRQVYVNGSNFTPGASLSVFCDSFGPYAMGNADSNGAFANRQTVCAVTPGTSPVTVLVRDSSNRSAQVAVN
jgi:hypothetical protein